MIRRNGFTLVEVLVSSVILIVLGTISITVYDLYDRGLNTSLITSRLHVQSEVLSQEIARKVRNGSMVLCSGESWAPDSEYSSTMAKEILIVDSLGNTTGGFRIRSGPLMQEFTEDKWCDFKCGTVNTAIDSISFFRLSSNRKEVTLYLSLIEKYKNRLIRCSGKGDMYQCRN